MKKIYRIIVTKDKITIYTPGPFDPYKDYLRPEYQWGITPDGVFTITQLPNHKYILAVSIHRVNYIEFKES